MARIGKLRWGRIATLGGFLLGLAAGVGIGMGMAMDQPCPNRCADVWGMDKRLRQLERGFRARYSALEPQEALTLLANRRAAVKRFFEDHRPEQRVAIDVCDRSVAEVVEELGRKVGVNILVEPEIKESVSCDLREVRWPQALNVLARLTRCELEVAADDVLLFKQSPRVTLQFSDANIRTVLRLIGAYAGRNVLVSPEVTGRVTLDLKDVHWLEALEMVANTVGPYRVEVRGELVRVLPRHRSANR